MFIKKLVYYQQSTYVCFRLQNLRKEVALVELDNYDEVRRKFLQHERLVKNIELQRLDDQLQKKVRERVN